MVTNDNEAFRDILEVVNQLNYQNQIMKLI